MSSQLDRIKHIVVLMLENRSFDHMLGYLALDDEYVKLHGHVDGIDLERANEFESVRYPVYPLQSTSMNSYDTPEHAGEHVAVQLGDHNGGFAEDFITTRYGVDRENVSQPDQCVVMGFHTGPQQPVLDHLARNYTVCDRWFASLPGATWPNRLYSMAGTSGGTLSNKKHLGKDFPVYNYPSIVRFLDEALVRWRWYRPYPEIPATIQLVEETYRLGGPHIHTYDQFFDDARKGDLPSVAWIDPSFFHFLGMEQNDDHPPRDLDDGENLIKAVTDALMASRAWPETLLIVTFDEHGGFYDHVEPPPAEDDFPATSRFGVRVPAILVSPFTRPGVCSSPFDHTSILRTILERFCRDVDPNQMGRRVGSANGLGEALSETDDEEQLPRPLPGDAVQRDLVGPPIDDGADDRKEFANLIAQSRDGLDLLQLAERHVQSRQADIVFEAGKGFDELQEGLLIATGEIARLDRRGRDAP